MFQIEENKQFEEMLKIRTIGEEQRLLEQTFNLVSTPAVDALGTPGMVPQDGRCAGNCVWDWTLAKSPLLLSQANRGHHGLRTPCRTDFHPTDALPSLPETRSIYYSLLLELLLPARGRNSRKRETCE